MNEVRESTVTHSTISHTEAFSHGYHFSTNSLLILTTITLPTSHIQMLRCINAGLHWISR